MLDDELLCEGAAATGVRSPERSGRTTNKVPATAVSAATTATTTVQSHHLPWLLAALAGLAGSMVPTS